MSFSVVTNISSLNSQAQLDKTNMHLQNTLARLTSGLRINSSADDAAGLAVAALNFVCARLVKPRRTRVAPGRDRAGEPARDRALASAN